MNPSKIPEEQPTMFSDIVKTEKIPANLSELKELNPRQIETLNREARIYDFSSEITIRLSNGSLITKNLVSIKNIGNVWHGEYLGEDGLTVTVSLYDYYYLKYRNEENSESFQKTIKVPEKFFDIINLHEFDRYMMNMESDFHDFAQELVIKPSIRSVIKCKLIGYSVVNGLIHGVYTNTANMSSTYTYIDYLLQKYYADEFYQASE